MPEGMKDRPGTNHDIKFLKDRVWNYNSEKCCLKVQLINNTGSPSVYGEIVQASTATDFAFQVTGVSDAMPIGVVAEADVADGELCWVVMYGICEVLLEDTTASTRGNWVYTSATGGRADATLAVPPGGGIPQLDTHQQEIGHALESVGAGTDVLCTIIMHFN